MKSPVKPDDKGYMRRARCCCKVELHISIPAAQEIPNQTHKIHQLKPNAHWKILPTGHRSVLRPTSSLHIYTPSISQKFKIS